MSGFSSFPFGALPALLLPWYASAARPLPWRETREPYRVWISEIMLQQTRVAAVLGYYARFLSALPDVAALAAVEEERLLKLWEGLGYYSRIVPFIKMKTPVQADKLPAMQKPSDKLAFMPRNRTLRKTGNILISQNRYIFQLGGKTTQPRS